MDRIRTFVRYGQLVLELSERPTVVGRGSSCDVVLDDELCSREHCRLAVIEGRTILTDLDSRNGVLVNGAKVEGTHELHHGDCITIGTQQLVVARQHRTPRVTPTVGEVRPRFEDTDYDPTGAGDIFQILHGAALSSIQNDDLMSAEASARNLFVSIRSAVSRSRPMPDGVLLRAIELGLKLADKSDDARWLDQVLELLVLARVTLRSDTARAFAELAKRVGKPCALALYLRMAREIGGDAEPSSRILQGL